MAVPSLNFEDGGCWGWCSRSNRCAEEPN